jgi:polyhydroxyalkanoate synthase
VGTELDHVVPWRSTYKINLQANTEVTYLLTNGGHNAGIISEPGHPGRRFRVNTQDADHHYHDPEHFLREAQLNDGSWWPHWVGWLRERSGAPTAPPAIGAPLSRYPPLGAAPGTYVLEDTDREASSAVARLPAGARTN